MFEDRTRDNITEKANVRLTYFRETGVAILSEVKITFLKVPFSGNVWTYISCKNDRRRYVVLL